MTFILIIIALLVILVFWLEYSTNNQAAIAVSLDQIGAARGVVAPHANGWMWIAIILLVIVILLVLAILAAIALFRRWSQASKSQKPEKSQPQPSGVERQIGALTELQILERLRQTRAGDGKNPWEL